jgi:hypothetical protein
VGGGAPLVSGKDWAADVVYPSILRCIWQLRSSRDCSRSVLIYLLDVARGADSDSQVGSITMASAASLKTCFCLRGIIHPETATLTMPE